MLKTKLISLRVDEDVLSLVEAFISKRPYLDRSKFIQRVLTAALKCSDEDTLHCMVDTNDPFSDGVILRAHLLEKK